MNSAILPTLLYSLECTVLLESHVRRLDSFLIRCLRIILGISVREQKCHTTIRKTAKQQRTSSILLQRRLRFLGHLSWMSNDRLPKQLLVSAPVGCKHNVDGQKRRWNDVVSGDLKQCNLLESWREKAEECNSWRSIIKRSAEHFNKKTEDKEKSLRDNRKRRCEQRLIKTESLLHCNHSDCSFQTFNKADLISHQHCHSTASRIPCQFCH